METRDTYFAFNQELATALIEELRRFFGSNPKVPMDCRWVGKQVDQARVDTDLDKTNVQISVHKPDNPRKFPQIVLNSISGRSRDQWFSQTGGALVIDNPDFSQADKEAAEALGEDYLEPEQLTVGERKTGKCDATLTLTVRAYSDAELDIFSDLVLHAFHGQVRRNLTLVGINWMPDTLSWSGNNQETLTERQPVSVRTFTFGLQGEWYDDFNYLTGNISDVVTGTITRTGPSVLL